jgi:hypothetical protein
MSDTSSNALSGSMVGGVNSSIALNAEGTSIPLQAGDRFEHGQGGRGADQRGYHVLITRSSWTSQRP